MARKKTGSTATKDRPKAKGKGRDDDIDDLAEEIENDLAKEFNFEDGDEGGESTSLLGKTVSFESDDGDMVTGKVVKQNGEELTIEDADAFWTATVEDVDLVDEKKGEDKKAAEKKGEGKKAAEKKGESKKAEDKKVEPEEELAELGELADDEPKKKATTKKAASKKATPVEEEEEEEEEEEDRVRPRRMFLLAAIKVGKARPREVDKETDDYKKLKADVKRRGQRDAIRVQSFSNPYLVEGGNRLAIFEELDAEFPGKGWDQIECQEDDQVEDEDDRIMNGLLDNEVRIAMHWIDLAKSFAKLIKGGKWTQGKISKALGISSSTVSRMVAALKLPKQTLEVARDAADNGVSAGVFHEMASAPKAVVKELTAAISDGRNVTMADVRALKKAADKAERDKERAKRGKDGDGEEDAGRGGRRGTTEPARAYTYRDLGSADVGDYIRVRVHGDRVELRFSVEWDKKTFRGFDPVGEVKGLFDAVFSEEECSLDSWKGLIKAMNAAKAELAGQG